MRQNSFLQENQTKVRGVLHQQAGAEHYNLRRYFPGAELASLVEQFWLVDWDLRGQPSHTQQNLPDPNFHLVIENTQVRLVCPVSKVYRYTMQGKGRIVGVKFTLGALTPWLAKSPDTCVDQQLDPQLLLGFASEELLAQLKQTDSDASVIAAITPYLLPLVSQPSADLLKLREIISAIKQDASLARVEQLAALSGVSVRGIQRSFQRYVGLNPKWLIRKYRLHQALDLLDDQQASIADLVAWLDYTDQPHLIRDFKNMLGQTPAQYVGKSQI